MPLSVFRPLSPAEHDQVLVRLARRAALIEYDKEVIQNARDAIQRSRELLKATKHQVIPPASEGDFRVWKRAFSGHQARQPARCQDRHQHREAE